MQFDLRISFEFLIILSIFYNNVPPLCAKSRCDTGFCGQPHGKEDWCPVIAIFYLFYTNIAAIWGDIRELHNEAA